MLDIQLQDFLSWPRDRRRSLLQTWERLKRTYSSENDAQLLTQRRINTFFDVRVPPDLQSLDSSYSPSDMSESTDYTSLASDLSGDTLLPIGSLSCDGSLADDDISDEVSLLSEASRIGWDTV